MIEIKADGRSARLSGKMDPMVFIAATLLLLATPGPTNTLLAASGAGVGLRRSLPLLAAELSGYLVSILVLRSVLGPVIVAFPVLQAAVRIAVAVYLVHLAVALWRHGARQVRDASPISFARVLVTTLLNPKAMIFAFTLLPVQVGILDLLPWLAGLAVEIVTVGTGWILFGVWLRRAFGRRLHPVVGYRIVAVALALLAVMINVHSFAGT
ncbi:MAG: LysE family transporter [Xanthobacteraceae bacterium]|nr:LysE family transporter [Xanthobacteraceae bacterium]